MKPDSLDIDRLVSETENGDLSSLYKALGLQNAEAVPLGRQNIEQIIYAGKQWWNDNEAEIREKVCNNDVIRAVAGNDYKDVVLAVAALLGVYYGLEKSVVLAVLVFRLGIGKWCRVIWERPAQEPTE